MDLDSVVPRESSEEPVDREWMSSELVDLVDVTTRPTVGGNVGLDGKELGAQFSREHAS